MPNGPDVQHHRPDVPVNTKKPLGSAQRFVGEHIIAELYGVDPILLDDEAFIAQAGYATQKRHDLPVGHVVENIGIPQTPPTSTLLHQFVPLIGTSALGSLYSRDQTQGTVFFSEIRIA